MCVFLFVASSSVDPIPFNAGPQAPSAATLTHPSLPIDVRKHAKHSHSKQKRAKQRHIPPAACRAAKENSYAKQQGSTYSASAQAMVELEKEATDPGQHRGSRRRYGLLRAARCCEQQ